MTLSLVMPAFQSAATLREAIDSVVNQSAPVQLIVMDGGSSDGTIAILESYGDRIQWASQPDEGQADALVKGFRQATGEIVGWLNADDLLESGAVEKVLQTFDSNPAVEWISGACIPFGDVPSGTPIPILPHIYTNRWEWLTECRLAQPSTFWRRHLMDTVGGIDTSYDLCMDYEFWVRLAFSGVQCHTIPDVISRFRWHPGSKSSSRANEFSTEIERLRRRYEPLLNGPHRASWNHWKVREESRNDLRSALSALGSGERSRARALTLRAIQKHPAIIKDRMFWGMIVRMTRGPR